MTPSYFLNGVLQGFLIMWDQNPVLFVFFAATSLAPVALFGAMVWAFWTGRLDEPVEKYRPVRRCVHWDRRQREHPPR